MWHFTVANMNQIVVRSQVRYTNMPALIYYKTCWLKCVNQLSVTFIEIFGFFKKSVFFPPKKYHCSITDIDAILLSSPCQYHHFNSLGLKQLDEFLKKFKCKKNTFLKITVFPCYQLSYITQTDFSYANSSVMGQNNLIYCNKGSVL